MAWIEMDTVESATNAIATIHNSNLYTLVATLLSTHLLAGEATTRVIRHLWKQMVSLLQDAPKNKHAASNHIQYYALT